jgi:putative cardiolipin synthase
MVSDRHLSISLLVISISLLIPGCATIPKDYALPEDSFSAAPARSGILADTARRVSDQYGPDHSGFYLLDSNRSALVWRLALIDEATTSIDIQTYLWYPDFSGRLILMRTLLAANRGVKVRLIVDDLLMIGKDKSLKALDNHPNIDIRLFNPWRKRNVGGGRVIETLIEMERINFRMHDKLLVADNQAVILGGRNIGDHYFGLSEKYNFHDLDFLAFGPVAGESSELFDHFWNSEWMVAADDLPNDPASDCLQTKIDEVSEELAASPELESFSIEVENWDERIEDIFSQLHPATSAAVYDTLEGDQIVQNMAGEIRDFIKTAESELLIVNAYIIPEQQGLDGLKELIDRGVRVLIVTNSLSSHDVPAVNSHYKPWRDDFILAGAELHEFRPDPAIKDDFIDTAPVSAKFSGLHSKATVVDRRYVFIGSMNFDPRSANINTEMGVFIDSPSLAEELAQLIERDAQPENSWLVGLDDQGELYWENSDERVTRQPARGLMQRIMDKIFMMFPKKLY